MSDEARRLETAKRRAEYTREWRKRNAERVKETRRARYWKNPERYRAYASEYGREQLAAIRAQRKLWRWANIELVRTRQRNRRGREAPGNGVSLQEWLAIVESFGGMCAYCLTRPATSMDHVDPLSRGGAHDVENVVPACGNCNASKRQRTLLEWMLYKGRAEA